MNKDEPEENLVDTYANIKLGSSKELSPYLAKATVLCTEIDPILVWDIMVLLPNNTFHDFSKQFGDSFVIDDHEHDPWVFTRVKSYEWLQRDFARRLPIALWIYQRALVIRDDEGQFKTILEEYKTTFEKGLAEIIRAKYSEFRTERHNLRHALEKGRRLSAILIKATVIKLALEIGFLVDKKPYPYKKWLSTAAENETKYGKELLQISWAFERAQDKDTVIRLSDLLVEKVATTVFDTGLFSKDFTQRWWLYLV